MLYFRDDVVSHDDESDQEWYDTVEQDDSDLDQNVTNRFPRSSQY